MKSKLLKQLDSSVTKESSQAHLPTSSTKVQENAKGNTQVGFSWLEIREQLKHIKWNMISVTLFDCDVFDASPRHTIMIFFIKHQITSYCWVNEGLSN